MTRVAGLFKDGMARLGFTDQLQARTFAAWRATSATFDQVLGTAAIAGSEPEAVEEQSAPHPPAGASRTSIDLHGMGSSYGELVPGFAHAAIRPARL